MHNIKGHRETEISLGRLTVLVGPNGAGKTTALQGLDALCRFSRQGLFGFFSGDMSWEMLARRGGEGDAMLGVEGGRRGDGAKWWLSVYGPPTESIRYGIGEQSGEMYPNDADVLDKDELLTLIELALGTCGLFRFNPDKLLAPTYTGEASPALRPDGEGLAEVLINMQLSDADQFAALQDALRAVVPEVERFHLRRVEVMRSKSRVLNIDGNTIPFTEPERVIGHELLFDISGCKNIPARATSEGTLIALGVLTALWTPNRQGLVLIDSLEHSLHPRAQWQLLAQIRSLLGTFPSLQVVATTHSPDLVDRLEPSEVVVMAVDKDGISRAQPLTNCPRSELFDTLSAGEMWSAMGESWVTKEET